MTVPRLSVTGVAKTFGEVPVSTTWSASNGSWGTTFSVPPGHYIVSSGSPHCTGETEQWVALPGGIRHVVITLNKTMVATVDENMYAGAIYGYLPTAAARVEVMRADGIIGEQGRRTAMVDGDTYQIGHLRAGDYVVRVTFGDVVASKAIHVPNDSYGTTVRADLTTADALSLVRQQAEGSGFVPIATYKNEPAETFKLGAASIDGWITAPLIPPSDYRPDAQRIDSTIAGALQVAQQFLSDDPNIPSTFRTLSKWSVEVLGKNDDDVVLNLTPSDRQEWQKQPPKTPDQCVTFSGAHYVRLAINDRTWKVDEARVCP